MSFRVSALVAVAAVLGLASFAPVSAQPQVPVRPRYSSFGSIFGSNNPAAPSAFGTGLGFGFQPGGGVSPVIFPGAGGIGPAAPGFFYPGQTAFPQVFPGAFGVNPLLPTTGVVGSFNNLGHWYGPRAGYYGHWYPNGVTSGYGVLSNAGGGMGYGGSAGYSGGSGFASGSGGMAGAGGLSQMGNMPGRGGNQMMRPGGGNQPRR